MVIDGRATLLAAMALASVAGCTVGPNFESPLPWSPAAWRGQGAAPTARSLEASMPRPEPVDAAWWSRFNDPVLSGLIARAVTSNLDVQTATARLAQSRAQRGVVGAGQFPQLNGNTSYTRQRPSKEGAISLFSGGAGQSASPGTAANGLAGTQGGAIPSSRGIPAFDLFQGGFDASWELDLWGRVRRQVESADATLAASAEARRAALISTVAEVARNYVQLRGVQANLRITRDNLASARESSRLVQERARGGLGTDLDAANAQAQAEGNAAQVPLLEQQEAQAINGIGLLLGMTPAALVNELSAPGAVPPVPPVVPIGIPSEVLRRRPDIRQAEAQLHAATADIGAAEADFYPRITLSGSLSLQATQLKNLGNIAAASYAFGPSLSIPIFEGGRLRRTLELREAQQQEAAIAYQRTVLQAFTEVDNALIAYGAEQRRRRSLVAQAQQSRRALGLAQSRFRQGISDFLEVLTAQRTVLAAEQQVAESTTTVSQNMVALYKALGGGWEAFYPDRDPLTPP